MGCAQQRVNSKLTAYVNRNLESLMKRTLVSVVREIPPPWTSRPLGRRPHDPRVVALCCILRVALRHTYESVESYLKKDQYLKRLVGTSRLPGHSVIHRGMDRLPMPYVRRVIRKTVWRLRCIGMDIAVDATGFSVSNRSMWFDIRMRKKSSRGECIKLHIAVDVDTGVIHSYSVTGWRGGDTTEFPRLIKELPGLGRVFGDGAYSSHANLKLVHEKGGVPYIKFHKHSVSRAWSSQPWKRSHRNFLADPDAWMAVYHRRSVVEAVFSSIKRTWGSTLRSRKHLNQRRELALKVLAYDVRQVLYNERARVLGVDLRTQVD
jgi:transposase